jgi:hypothetical protein
MRAYWKSVWEYWIQGKRRKQPQVDVPIAPPKHYPSQRLKREFIAETVLPRLIVRKHEASFELPLRDNEDFAIFFPAPDGKVDQRYLETALRVLLNCQEMDDAVESLTMDHWKRSGWEKEQFHAQLGYATLQSIDRVQLRYWGTSVNTEWDVSFVLSADGAIHLDLDSKTGIPLPRSYAMEPRQGQIRVK